MKMKFLELIINTKKEPINFPFSETFTYNYGKMGAGKTTIVKLLSFCLGENLVETPALQQEFVSAKLHLVLGKNDVYLTRDIYENKVLVEWKELNVEDAGKYVQVPINGDKGVSLLPDAHIENLSDMLFYLIGSMPPKVRKNKTTEASELVRLSFRNIMWFWNLDQDSIDSSFFHLEEKNGFHRYASRDVMRMVLGYYYEKIAMLENELSSIQSIKRGVQESINQLTEFLKEHEIDDISLIDKKIEELKETLRTVECNRVDSLEKIAFMKPHVTDKLRHEIHQYVKDISTIESAIINITKQIELKKQLQEEYFYASIKAKNLEIARDILKDVGFQTCPECGKEVTKTPNNICSLCKQDVESEGVNRYSQMEIDLIERRNEITYSLNKMMEQKGILSKQLKDLVFEKEKLDVLLTKEESEYDSLYLSNIKQIDNQIQILNSDIRYWNKIRILPLKIQSLYTELGIIVSDEEKKKNEIQSAKENADMQENQLEKLKEIFLDTLNKVNFPGIQQSDSVYMTTKDFYPKILTKDNDIYEIDFIKLSSGGKKTIYKACFAIALQRLMALSNSRNEIPFPNVLIIDTPMKNISERENKDIFESFYKYIYNILQNELKDLQLIIIDKEFYAPDKSYKLDILSKHMTNDNPQYPGLIHYYKGH